MPARARIEALIEWVAPVAEEIGAAPFLAVPAANAAERQRARWQDGATLEQIYARKGSPVSELADEHAEDEEAAEERRDRGGRGRP